MFNPEAFFLLCISLKKLIIYFNEFYEPCSMLFPIYPKHQSHNFYLDWVESSYEFSNAKNLRNNQRSIDSIYVNNFPKFSLIIMNIALPSNMVNLLIASDRYRLLLKYSLIVFLKKCSIFSWFVHSLQVFHLRAWPLCASVIIYYIYICKFYKIQTTRRPTFSLLLCFIGSHFTEQMRWREKNGNVGLRKSRLYICNNVNP